MVFLRYLDDRTTDSEELEAIKRRFEQSAEWQEHLAAKHFDEQNAPRPMLWEEEKPREELRSEERFADQPQRPMHRVKVGGCECQPRLGFMQLSDNGDVAPAAPAPFEEVKEQYGSATVDSATYGVNPQGGNLYLGSQKDLYR